MVSWVPNTAPRSWRLEAIDLLLWIAKLRVKVSVRVTMVQPTMERELLIGLIHVGSTLAIAMSSKQITCVRKRIRGIEH